MTDDRTIGQLAALACLLEVTATKPGNVHRGADFDDVGLVDYLLSAVAIEPAMSAAAAGRSLGDCVLSAIEATQAAVGKNTNLGTVLLLAPLAKVPRDRPLAAGVRDVLGELRPDDATKVYQAIRIARPGGLGRVREHDVDQPPPDDLLVAMRVAAPRDMVARQYSGDFADVLQCVVPWLKDGLCRCRPLNETIVQTHVRLMTEFPDSLIARKCGVDVAQQAAAMAATALAAGKPGDESYEQELSNLDFWLRSDGHRRNPGTTADLIAAGLFAALRDGIITLPLSW